MRFIADFHIHSKYSRATSKNMDIESLAHFAKLKGIGLLGTGDWTHPQWLLELKGKLRPSGRGIFEYNGVRFILTVEVSNIYSSGGKTRKIHNIIFVPSFETAERVGHALGRFGKLFSDGRPILGLESDELVKIILNIDKDAFIVPAHIWTPWFSLFGANSGFDRIEECFKDQTKNIYALETGLSSDPRMNWRWSALDRFSLISNSDAHSPPKLGREANVFDCEIDYFDIMDTLKKKDNKRLLYTIEFFPQEGKYHYDGHRGCKLRLSPREAVENNNICPVCKKPITVGVLHRIEELADRTEDSVPEGPIGFKNLIPLLEIIAEARCKLPASQVVQREYMDIVQRMGGEFEVLIFASPEDLKSNLPSRIAEGILRVRNGQVKIEPGFDGEYGKITVFSEETGNKEKQITFF